MHLKNLTVLGFKSFADRTSLDFEPGITAIVGPNGCGKSNVADAIRWVLGEQSAKALRGGEMADVIFNGTDKRKAIGMAEVSLTISDIDAEQLRTAGVKMEYTEVTLTRRVFRDGGSEYFINKVPSRLKDIQQLFMGTGVGRTSYSIMAQGNITQILSSKPEDRRLVFEEAAGITKYKSQKREALRKLDYTEQNLLRVQDLIKEVKRQIGSLQRQAGKARRYQKYRNELQELETKLARHQFDQLQAGVREKQTQNEELTQRLESQSEILIQTEEQVRRLRSSSTELEQEISQAQQSGLSLGNRIESNTNQITFHQERIDELKAQNSRALAEIETAKQRRDSTLSELDELKTEWERASRSLAEDQTLIEANQTQVDGIDAAIVKLQERLRQAQSDAFAIAQELAKSHNELSAFDLLKKGNQTRLEKLSAEKIQLEEERTKLEGQLEEFTAGVEARRKEAARLDSLVAERQSRLAAIQEESAAHTAELDGLLREQAELQSKLNVLQELDASREGFSEAAVTALSQSDRTLGSLTDFIRVPDEYLTAVEAALAHHLQLVITQTDEAAQAVIADLQARIQGRANLVSLQLLASASEETSPAPSDTAAISEVVTCSPEAEPIVRQLLARTFLVEDLGQATEQWKRTQGRFDFVTRDGELLSRQGVYSSGATTDGNQESPSILKRKNEILELTGATAKLAEAIDREQQKKETLSAEKISLQTSLQTAQTELKAVELAIATDEGEHALKRNSLAVLHQKIETVRYEIQSLAEQQEEHDGQRTEHARKAELLQSKATETKDLNHSLAQELEAKRKERESAVAELTDRKVTMAAARQSCASLEQRKSPLEQRAEELSQLLEERQQDIQDVLTKTRHSETVIADAQEQLASLSEEQDLNNRTTAGLLQQRSHRQAEIDDRESGLSGLRQEVEDYRQKKHELEVLLAEDNLKSENLCRRIEEKYQIDLKQVAGEDDAPDEKGEDRADGETPPPEAAAPAKAETDWETIAEQVQELQAKVESIGPVNLVAIEEYEETEQRFKFLTEQNDDLVKSKDELHQVLNRINTETREMFLQTFAQIRENFRHMFQELFGGGNADLRISDEDEVLESGIDIVARPPGKRLQSLSLLSGGEQTMTAVSLLFSIYQVKPSPFCVLDELDAPLDESNINRFLKVLQRFLEFSQFIIITHNNRTISTADVLYGVTMQERGVSQMVSVKFHKERDGEQAEKPVLVETG